MTIRTLVLSGGGGRGAFHAGVYKYLSEANKANVDDAHSGPWIPEIVLGTSIGAVNGAAIVQGISAEALEQFWLSLREHHIQGLPPGMGWLARHVANALLRHAIGVRLPVVPPDKAFSPGVRDSWPPLPVLPASLSNRLIGRWNNLLDTGPLYNTLINRLGLDEKQIAASDKTLLIRATNVRTGEGVAFSNRDLANPRGSHIRTPITIKRIIASCSIPMIYPWTKDEDGEVYWDGAVLANTPLGPAFDIVKDRPIEEPMEIVIVMMTPWWENAEDAPSHEQLPQDFGEAMTWTLDWALLSSFRVDLKFTRSCNMFSLMTMEAGQRQRYRYVDDIIVAPTDFLPVTRIIDYDEPASRQLVDMGYAAAKQAFETRYAVYRDTEGAVVLLTDSQGRVAMQLRDNKPGLPGANQWGLFGGLLLPGEQPQVCILREIEEELGIHLSPDKLRYIDTHHIEKQNLKTHVYRYVVDDELNNVTLREGQAWRFISPAEFEHIAVAAPHPSILRTYWDV